MAGAGIGSTIGNLFSGGLGLVVLGLGALIIFRKPITEAFGQLGQGIGNVQLPEINLPSINFPEIRLPSFEFPEIRFPEIEFPDFEFPTFEFPNPFGNGQEETPPVTQPLDQPDTPNAVNPADDPQFPTDLDVLVNSPEFQALSPEEKRELLFSLRTQEEIDTDTNLDPNRFLPPTPDEPTSPDRDFDLKFLQRQQEILNQQIRETLPEGFDFDQPAGSGFVGASITETPIANLSLSQIIDRFGVSASKAADIRARARDDFGDFDFGTNTGSGIGSIFEDIRTRSSLPTSNVSDSRFEGKSAEEIANILTGGNISNF